MANEEIEGFDEVLKNLDALKIDSKQKSKIIESGARIIEKELKEKAKEAGYNSDLPNMLIYSNGTKYVLPGHFSDHVTHKPNQYLDGSTDIGFDKAGVAVAHWVNNGTYRQKGKHFMEEMGQEDHDEAFEAMAEKARNEIFE